MAHIRLDDKQIELSAGGVGIGTDGEATVPFRAVPAKGILATIIVDPGGTATARWVSAGATIQLTGVALGEKPAPPLYGDWIEVAGRQLRVSDDRNTGSTGRSSVFGTAAAPIFPHPSPKVASTASAKCPTARRNNAVASKGAPPVPTLEAENGRASRRRVAALRAALAHIGRGEQYDVVVGDDSSSASRAMIQRRESGWFVEDMLSTNRSYASGACAPGKQARKADPVVRFGCMKVIFRSEPERVDADGGSPQFVEFKPLDQWRAPSARPSLS